MIETDETGTSRKEIEPNILNRIWKFKICSSTRIELYIIMNQQVVTFSILFWLICLSRVDWWRFVDLVVFQGTLACYFMTPFFASFLHAEMLVCYKPFWWPWLTGGHIFYG